MQMPALKPPKVFLVSLSPHKLTAYERGAIVRHFGRAKPEFVRIELTDWKTHLDFCIGNVDKKYDIVLISSIGAKVAQMGTAYWAVAHGFVHAFFGKDLRLRQLTDIVLKSKRLPRSK